MFWKVICPKSVIQNYRSGININNKCSRMILIWRTENILRSFLDGLKAEKFK